MANEKKLGKHDVLIKRIEGETVDGQPTFAMAIFDAGANVASAEPSSTLVTLRSVTGSNVSFQSDAQYTPAGYVGVYLILDIVGLPASGTIALFVDLFNPSNNEYSAVYQTSYIPATGTVASTRTWLVRPDVVDDAGLLTGVGRIPIPSQWRLRCLHGGGSGTWGYNLGYQYVS